MKTVMIYGTLMLASVGNPSVLARPLVTEYTNKANWQTAVNNNYSTVDFVGYPQGMFVTNQYQSLGILFTDGNDSIDLSQTLFLDDGAGLEGNNIFHVSFTTPINWIAADYPGKLKIKLYNQGNLIYTSSDFGFGGVGFFAGLVTTAPFDAAVINDPERDDVLIDNLFFGPPIPSPGPLALLGIAALLPNWRRRRI